MRAHGVGYKVGSCGSSLIPLSCSPRLESQVIQVQGEQGGSEVEAQQESRGVSAEERRPESRVRLSGTGSKTDRDGASTDDLSRKTLTSSNTVLLTDPTPCTESSF